MCCCARTCHTYYYPPTDPFKCLSTDSHAARQTDFETSIYAADPTSAIFTFDYTVNQNDPRVAHRKEFTFYSWGLGDVSSGAIRTLADIASTLGHKHIDVLKIDIEAAEFAAVPQFLADPRGPSISQIMLEVHYITRLANYMGRGLALHKALDAAGYEIVSSEWNALTAAAACLKEYVFVRRDSGLLLL